MGKDWDRLWATGAGMSKVGIGDRNIPWPSHGGSLPHGGMNPTCAECGGRLRGAKKCTCEQPHDHWKPVGKRRGKKVATGGASFTTGGSERFSDSPLPSFTGDQNPICENCGGSKRGNDRKGFKRCRCDNPSFPNTRLEQTRAMQEWHRQWLEEVFRVLKPGGVIKVFGATRTFHRMAAAMEQVGFVDLDLEAWMYGCLPDDSEILTETGWKSGLEVQVGEKVACWDSKTDDIRLEPVEEVIQAPFEGDLICFRNDNTDQLLTPNHRVYKKHRIRKMIDGVRQAWDEPEWNVEEAGQIDRWNNLRLPLAGVHDGSGIGGTKLAALLGWVWTEGGFDQNGTGVRIYQSSVNMEHVQEIYSLVEELIPEYRHYERERTYKDRDYIEHTWFFTGPMALHVREMLPGKRPSWHLLWQMTREEKHAFVDAVLKGDGACDRGRWAFYQKDPEDLVWFQTLAHLMNRQGRINFRKAVVGLHMNPMTQLQARHLKAAVTEHYEGPVWCVRVPTGAFLARRKDQIFITGNSGFPKSLNISKALDKKAGAVREKIRIPAKDVRNPKSINSGHGIEGGDRPWMREAEEKGFHEKDGEVPVSEEAQRYEGYGTALKPAWEPFVVGRKPEI